MRVRRQFGGGIDRQSDTVVSGMIDGFLNFNVKLLAANSLRDDVAGLTSIRVRTAARAGLLRISAVAFHEPGSRLQKPEMRPGGLRRKGKSGDDQKQTNRKFHAVPPFPVTIVRPLY